MDWLIKTIFGGSSEQRQSASMNNPVSHQDNLNQANPQFNTYYYQPNNVAQHGIAPPQYCQPGNTPQQPLTTFALPTPSVPASPEDLSSIVQWIPSSPKTCSELEGRAVVGGYSIKAAPLWVIRTAYEGDLLPAALNYGTKDAFVAYGQVEVQIYVFEVCCAPANRVRWIESSHGKVPPNAVVGGRTTSGEKLYVGRAYVSKSRCPGKIQPSHGVIYVSFGYKAYSYEYYEVMCIV